MAVNDEYRVDDYRHALERLLPPGKYWQEIEKHSDLDKLLYAVAEEFKTTADDVKLNLLFQFDNTLQGWKLSDYQAILDTNNIDGTVSDHPDTPNIIYLQLNSTQDLFPVFQHLEAYRLPHTQLNWKFLGAVRVNGLLRSANHYRIELTEA